MNQKIPLYHRRSRQSEIAAHHAKNRNNKNT